MPTAICADFDLFFEAADFGSILIAANIPSITSESLKAQKSGLLSGLSESDRSKIKSSGINYFEGEKKEVAIEFVDRLAKYGIFIIPNGELESWLPKLDVSGRKVGRVIQILEKMGSDPLQPEYIMPSDDDIWKYIQDVTAWIKNPGRSGM